MCTQMCTQEERHVWMKAEMGRCFRLPRNTRLLAKHQKLRVPLTGLSLRPLASGHLSDHQSLPKKELDLSTSRH